MMRRHRGKRLLTALMALVCIALAWTIYRESALSTADSFADIEADVSAEVAMRPPPAAFAMPDKASLEVILERPVFAPTRRPSRRVVESAPVESLDFTLSGVVISGSERAALVRVGNAGAARQVKEGEEINGWVLVSVAEDRVIVRRDSLELEVFLDYAGPTVGARDRKDDSPAVSGGQQPE